jgi:hypothetical protein
MDGRSTQTSKGLQSVPKYNYAAMGELQPGVEFVSWGEYGRPERVQPASVQGSTPTAVDPTPPVLPLVDSTEGGGAVVSGELVDHKSSKPHGLVCRRTAVSCVDRCCGGVGDHRSLSKHPSRRRMVSPPTSPTISCDSWYGQTQLLFLTSLFEQTKRD